MTNEQQPPDSSISSNIWVCQKGHMIDYDKDFDSSPTVVFGMVGEDEPLYESQPVCFICLIQFYEQSFPTQQVQ